MLVQYAQREWMEQKATYDGLHVVAIEIGMLNAVQEGIAPVQAVRLIINGHAIGPAQLLLSYPLQAGPVVIDAGNVGRSLPFGEEDEALVRVDGDGAGPAQIGHDGAAPCRVAETHAGQGGPARVQEEEQLRRPVHRDALDALVLREDNGLLAGTVRVGAINDIGHHVREVDVIVACVEIQRDKVRAAKTPDYGHNGVRE